MVQWCFVVDGVARTGWPGTCGTERGCRMVLFVLLVYGWAPADGAMGWLVGRRRAGMVW